MATPELTYQQHGKETMKLAVPIILSYIGVMITGIVDSLMVGQLGTDPIASVALGNNLFILFLLFPMGIAMGITPLVSKARGAKKWDKIQNIFSHAMAMHLCIAVIMVALALMVRPLYYHIQQPEHIVDGAMPYYTIVTFSMIPFMLFTSFKQFAEGLAMPNPGMVISLLGNMLNVGLNYVLIFGEFGFPKLGVEGAAWATFWSRVVMMLAGFGFMLFHSKVKPYMVHFFKVTWKKIEIREQLKMGVPIALQTVLEVGAFVVGAMIIGSYGAAELAAHHIAIQVVALTYRMASGIATATTVRVSHAIGEGKLPDMRRAGQTGIAISGVFMLCMMVVIFLLSSHVHAWFVDDPVVHRLGTTLLLIAAIFQFVDGIQVVALGALRGMEDVNIPTVIALVTYWGIMLPIGWVLAVNYNMTAEGVWWGYMAGIGLAAIWLYYRFNVVSKKIVAHGV